MTSIPELHLAATGIEMAPCVILTPLLEPPANVVVPEKFAAATVAVPVRVGEVNDLFVIV